MSKTQCVNKDRLKLSLHDPADPGPPARFPDGTPQRSGSDVASTEARKPSYTQPASEARSFQSGVASTGTLHQWPYRAFPWFCPEQIHSKHWRPGLLGHMGVFSIGSFPFLASVWVDWWVDWSWNQRLRLGSTPGHTQRTVGPKPRPPRSIKSRNVWATAPGGGGTLGGKMD